ncbi:hypothetical protein JHK85_048912 [Glycine max]|uniref:Uncharacterized protein n=2 Tax=Glycine subgen. Soja TaxID=1462606 RepID=A0A0R0FGB8_SOYBN|nr:hypothetical protein JHK86_048279 [Glycine max]KAG4934067.1 hypothetical protein JHK87_048069 [Glycine soja]KAG4944266.1 hypothetical protein JHK85_048912 [Glycine max]KAH1119462.1 hypothetical protein GYH30_048019 [Glycine max]RZB57949.1 hypothetical protein D0Y65_046559 [Glycine soja]
MWGRKKLRNIVAECKNILVVHSSYGIGFVKRQADEVSHELARVTSLFPSLYFIHHVNPCIEHYRSKMRG